MKSLREGMEWFELEYGGKVFNQGVGGVDFSKQPKRNISRTRFPGRPELSALRQRSGQLPNP